jgi:hypothetical protein
MTGETPRDEDQRSGIEIEILWQHDRDGVWWAIFDTGERAKLIEPWQLC